MEVTEDCGARTTFDSKTRFPENEVMYFVASKPLYGLTNDESPSSEAVKRRQSRNSFGQTL
jgi:hypothetical protein